MVTILLVLEVGATSSAVGGSSPFFNIPSVFLNLLMISSFISLSCISTSSMLNKFLWQALHKFCKIYFKYRGYNYYLIKFLTDVGTSSSTSSFPKIVPRDLFKSWLLETDTWNILVQERADEPTLFPHR